MKSIVSALLSITMLLRPRADAIFPRPQSMAAEVSVRQSVPACSEDAIIEDLWLVEQLNVTYTGNELVRPGNATWTITNTLTNTSVRLHCPLRANYICEMNGTPEDDSLHIWLQINLDVARFTINQSVPCGTDEALRSAYAIGTAELYLLCDGEVIEDELSCYDDGSGSADGSVVVASSSVTL